MQSIKLMGINPIKMTAAEKFINIAFELFQKEISIFEWNVIFFCIYDKFAHAYKSQLNGCVRKKKMEVEEFDKKIDSKSKRKQFSTYLIFLVFLDCTIRWVSQFHEN